MRRSILIAALLIVAVAIGEWSLSGSDGEAVVGVVPLEHLPAGFMSTARKELPQVKFDRAWKLRNGNFEIRGKDAKGKAREVELNAKGQVVEVD